VPSFIVVRIRMKAVADALWLRGSGVGARRHHTCGVAPS